MQEHRPEPVTYRVRDRDDLPTLPSIQPPAPPSGCISKKWLFYTLRPYSAVYRSQVIHDFLNTADRLQRCGISPDELGRVRVFSAEATAVILSDLRQLNFIS